jgi:hypothetical protein
MKAEKWKKELERNLSLLFSFFLPIKRGSHFLFEAEGFGLPCTAWAGSGLLVKSRLIRIRADEGARERTRSFEIELIVLCVAGRDIPIKRADRHAIIYYVMHKQAW